jgi:dCMP deaminase
MKSKFKKYFMTIAEETAKLSHATRAKVGCIIVKDNRIISIGYNGMPSGWDNTCEDTFDDMGVPVVRTKPEVLHAEANAITKLAQSNESSQGSSLFCTHMPCIECAKLIHQSGISTVYYLINYKAAKGSGEEFLKISNIGLEQCQL